jgi:hypothetical protein
MHRRKLGIGIAAALLLSACAAAPGMGSAGDAASDGVRINQLQAIGTHNSYKEAIPPAELAIIRERNVNSALGLDYGHRTIAEQLDAGARQLEIDPTDDPVGDVFTRPLMFSILKERGLSVPDYDLSDLKAPGIKVIHAPDIDFRSHCLLFVDCLKQTKAWSDRNPAHSPVLIMVNPKSEGISWPGAAKVRPWDGASFERMEREILSVFPKSRIITPDEVRGDKSTLREAVLAGGWPTLEMARGRVIFAMDLSPEANAPYAAGHPSLKGRLAFINTYPDAPEAAYFTMNDAIKDQALIQERVRAGFLVRTRADADTREARTGDTTRREAALSSGAQYISTDYMSEDVRFGKGYTARLPGDVPVRCNPVNAPAACTVK